jgi:hypothetical protein
VGVRRLSRTNSRPVIMFGWIGPVGVLAMNSVHRGWFFNNKEWIEYIILTVVLWLLMMTAIHEFDLRSAG